MKEIKLTELSQSDLKRIFDRARGVYDAYFPTVKSILDKVKTNALGGELASGTDYSLAMVEQEEVKNAYSEAGQDFLSSCHHLARNILAFHQAQLPTKEKDFVSPESGISIWREWRAIDRVGIYIPGGQAVYPSSVMMTVIPAKVAGCGEIVVCSPPNEATGKLPSVTLAVADMLGVKEIYKLGGAEAIAFMAYGDANIRPVYKIFGAGGPYSTVAKMLVQEVVAIDMPAGPSEVFIIADGTANPKFIAADLLADGEHGEDSACVLLTTSEEIAKKTIGELERQLETLPNTRRIKESLSRYGLIAIVTTLDEAINFANEYAPEHLEIMAKDASALVPKIRNVGSIFLGDWTAKAAGDYGNGANHVLPTGGAAKMYAPLSVESFGRWIQVQKCSKDGLARIRNGVEILSTAEGLPAHTNSIRVRFEE